MVWETYNRDAESFDIKKDLIQRFLILSAKLFVVIEQITMGFN